MSAKGAGSGAASSSGLSGLPNEVAGLGFADGSRHRRFRLCPSALSRSLAGGRQLRRPFDAAHWSPSHAARREPPAVEPSGFAVQVLTARPPPRMGKRQRRRTARSRSSTTHRRSIAFADTAPQAGLQRPSRDAKRNPRAQATGSRPRRHRGFYGARNYTPLWVSETGLTEAGGGGAYAARRPRRRPNPSTLLCPRSGVRL
jgi:hypothetical protein